MARQARAKLAIDSYRIWHQLSHRNETRNRSELRALEVQQTKDLQAQCLCLGSFAVAFRIESACLARCVYGPMHAQAENA